MALSILVCLEIGIFYKSLRGPWMWSTCLVLKTFDKCIFCITLAIPFIEVGQELFPNFDQGQVGTPSLMLKKIDFAEALVKIASATP